MAKKDKEEAEKEPDYSFKPDKEERSIEQQVEMKLIEQEMRRREKDSIHILDIAKNPPEPDYMKTELLKAELRTKDQDDKDITYTVAAMPLEKNGVTPEDNTVFTNKEGDKVKIFDPIFEINLRQMFEGQISDCASTIFPMLMDEYVQLALDEKKARQTEKRKEEFKWWWILVLMMILIPIILITVTVLPGLMGGG